MDILKEQLNRSKELMGILNEQGSGSDAPESFTGSGKSCAAGYMWSEEEGDCVRMDIRYVRDRMYDIGEIRELTRELKDDTTIAVMSKKIISSVYESLQEVLKDLDDTIFKGGRMSKKNASNMIQQGKTKSHIINTVIRELQNEGKVIRNKLINDIKTHRVNLVERVLSSEGIVELLSILDEKTRERVIDDYKRYEEKKMRGIGKDVENNVFTLIKWIMGYFKKDTRWITDLARTIESRREGEVILPIIKTPEKMFNSEKLMNKWEHISKNNQHYSTNWLKELERTIDTNLDEV